MRLKNIRSLLIQMPVVSGSSWSPKRVSGLKLWLDASAILGADADPVTTWADKSGNAHDASEATHPPILKLNIVNGKPVVRFDGAAQYLTILHHADLNLTAPFHIFAVVITDAVSGTYLWWASKASAWQLNRYAAKINFSTTGKKDYTSTLSWMEASAVKLQEVLFDASYDVTHYVNGWAKETIAGAADPTTNTNAVLLGKNSTTCWDGDIAEILIYSGTLSAANRARIVNYLAAKYGIYISAADVDQAIASRAAAPLTTPTHDGHGETVQPDVAYNAAGWNGYKYWMMCTSYPTDDRTEALELLASNDGDTWEAPAGLTNPVLGEPAPAGFEHADPCLFFSPDGLTLNCVYYYRNGIVEDALRLTTSTDGVNWTAPVTILTASGGEILRSPSVAWDGAQYILWTCETTAGKFRRRTCATLTGTWSDAVDCVFKMTYGSPEAGLTFHGHVKISGGVYYGFYTNATNGYLLSSADGVTWQVPRGRTLAAGSGTWDTYIYSCSILKLVSGFDLFYSGRTGDAAPVYHIGRTTITGIA
jgi:hypothetical protein